MAEVKEIEFRDEKPKRVDIFLAGSFPDCSRSYFQSLIKEGLVRINGAGCLSSSKLRKGDTVLVDFIERKTELLPQEVDFDIIHEDRHVLVIDKPHGLVVHPACGHEKLTLLNGLMYYLGKQTKLPRLGLVHRLDKDTSGIMVVAKSELAFKSLAKQFTMHSVKKIYLAFVQGRITEDEGYIEKPVARSTRDRKKMEVASNGRRSLTRFKVLERFKAHTFLEVMPETGRTHQIRVHMVSIGHPILGDNYYNPSSGDYSRMMLHAYKLGFTHPLTKKDVEYKSKIPEDFKNLLKRFRNN